MRSFLVDMNLIKNTGHDITEWENIELVPVHGFVEVREQHGGLIFIRTPKEISKLKRRMVYIGSSYWRLVNE